MWICSRCHARVEPTFDVCWRCGTSSRGEEDPEFVTADEAEPIFTPTDYLRLDPGKMPESELPEAPLELVTCLEGISQIEAHFVAHELLAEGIPATVQGIRHTKQSGLADVVVRAEDIPRVMPIVGEFRERKRSREARGGLSGRE